MSKEPVFSENQNIASNPTENVWVQANAGTGKTTVLIRRLLRILFRSGRFDNNQVGVLCLTYTNAAAGEMKNRILEELQKWSMADDNELTRLLDGVVENSSVTVDDLNYARHVFFLYIDNPDMLKIKTIHSFCEEILHRFPLEAGISPAWSLVSGSAQKVLLQEAFDLMIKSSADGNRTMKAFNKIIDTKSEYFIDDLRGMLLSRYKSFFMVNDTEQYRKYFIDTTRKILNLNNTKGEEIDQKILESALEYAKSVKKPAGYVKNIINFIKQYIDNTVIFEEYKKIFLTQKNEIKDDILKHEELCALGQRIYEIQQEKLNEKVFENTIALFDLAMHFADSYRRIKQERNLLDFEDLILCTQRLFMKPDVMGWVLSQLDVSLSHILVDEAQDTSPQQWNILRMLAGDFFTDGDTENNRSIFVVGDSKQSIYGFQNADPHAFAESRQAIADQIANNYRDIKEISLDQSYRSVEPVLKTVDYFFGNPVVVANTGFYNNKHVCYRKGESGCVELHNLTLFEDKNTDKNKLYVNLIADKIQSLIKDKGFKPNDIMVLVQKRHPFVNPLSIALKKRGIDVAGSDRVKLPNFPAIKDMIYLTRFCIDNTDDYSLCCLLKSPIYRLKEADIYNLCNYKNKNGTKENPLTVLEALKELNQDIYNDLIDTINASKTMAPYSFFTYVLNKNNNRERIIAALGKHVIDPIEEFLTMCLAYERTQPGTLYHFLKWFITGDSEIKRDMDASQGVRIMTVHGSKGLASPVVFLIDTVYVSNIDDILNTNYLHNNPEYDLWIWKSGDASNIVQQIIDKNKQEKTAENYRLLYVAMTRTRDELYIYGCGGAKKPSEICWHSQLWNVLSHIKDARVDENTIRITNDTEIE